MLIIISFSILYLNEDTDEPLYRKPEEETAEHLIFEYESLNQEMTEILSSLTNEQTIA